MQQRIVAIIKTFPVVFFRELSLREFVRQWRSINQDGSCWVCPMPAVPRQEVLYCYIVIGNRIRYRCNISHFEPGGERIFSDGRRFTAKAWMVLTAPVVKPPHKIKKRGFQGFRYSEFLF